MNITYVGLYNMCEHKQKYNYTVLYIIYKVLGILTNTLKLKFEIALETIDLKYSLK